MQYRYYLDIKSITVIAGGILFGILLILVPLIISGALVKLTVYVIPALIVTGVLWLAMGRGTYITIDADNLYGTAFFIRGKVTRLSDVVAVKSRKTFAGAMTEVYLTYRKKDGAFGERGLVNKESLKKSDFTKLLDTIHSANPSAEIASDLLARK